MLGFIAHLVLLYTKTSLRIILIGNMGWKGFSFFCLVNWGTLIMLKASTNSIKEGTPKDLRPLNFLISSLANFCYNIHFYVSITLAGCFLLKKTWSRLGGAWRGWRTQRGLKGLQRRLVEEEEELDDVCSICHADYAAGDEVSPNPNF